MNYFETLEYLYTQLPMFHRVGAIAYKKDLTNTIKLCNLIGNPHLKFKSIHIAGTNGKGSTSHMLAAIMQTAGYKTGLYTSPHLKDFRERIRIDGIMCSKDFVIEFVEKIKPQLELIKPSFFELTVAMGFDFFAKQKVDIAIIETGLGGRLDSTNIINPILSIITNIGFDHMDILGNTIQEIAFEKAGIIKKNTPIVIGEYTSETKSIFIKKAINENSKIFFAQDNYYTSHHKSIANFLEISIKRNEETNYSNYKLDNTGIYQIKNFTTVLEACYQLNKMNWKIDNEVIYNSISQVKKLTGLMGRWQCIQENPKIILDVAHNVDGIKQILLQLHYISYTKLHIIIGMVKDKDVRAVLSLLPKNANYYFTKSQIERALPQNELQQIASKFNLIGETFLNVTDALESAKLNSQSTDLILVCGSVYLVGEVDF